jgi:hypothetical protein
VLITRSIKSWGKVLLIVVRRVSIFGGETGLVMGVVDKIKDNGTIDLGVGGSIGV